MADTSETAQTKVPAEAPTTDSAADTAAAADSAAPTGTTTAPAEEASNSTTDGIKIVPGEKPDLKLIWCAKSFFFSFRNIYCSNIENVHLDFGTSFLK